MSKKRTEQRLSLRQTRQSSKIDRLLKFIQANSPVKIIHPHHNHSLNGTPNNNNCNINININGNLGKGKVVSHLGYERTGEKIGEIGNQKEKINQVINNYLDKKLQARRTQSRQFSAMQVHKIPQSHTKFHQKQQQKHVKSRQLPFMNIRPIKTQQNVFLAKPNLTRVGELISNMQVMGSKKYQSLLMLNKYGMVGDGVEQRNKGKNGKNLVKNSSKSISRQKQEKYIEISYTGWQTNHNPREILQQFTHNTNFY